ncbi:hypothetical protein ABZ876_27805 [Streptomyces sp. NPDC046931]|uniref:hypothetical protein n=1 Tax=Streptomyces sp. NPDC046931 TaxID=3154806 RepID=UPI0033F04447
MDGDFDSVFDQPGAAQRHGQHQCVDVAGPGPGHTRMGFAGHEVVYTSLVPLA